MAMTHQITTGAHRNKLQKRKGRGRSSGMGKTSGRGTKAAHGGDVHWIPGREGGQTPIFRRLPKRGFNNNQFAQRFSIVNVSDLEHHFDKGATVDTTALIAKGLVRDERHPVKILGDGELTKKLTVIADAFSASAKEKIEKAGGSATEIKKAAEATA